jgi:hypothetical protein
VEEEFKPFSSAYAGAKEEVLRIGNTFVLSQFYCILPFPQHILKKRNEKNCITILNFDCIAQNC